MAEYIILSYRRVGQDLSTGSVLSWKEDGTNAQVLESFDSLSYQDLLLRFASHMKSHPSASGVFHRTDKPGLAPMKIIDEEAELFREDPHKAIQHYLVPRQVVHVGVPKYVDKFETIIPPLVVGYDMRADFFGELVFVRVREGKIECPSCGKWVGPVGTLSTSVPCSCGLKTEVEDLQHRWAGVSVQSLLSSGVERFFLPRKWNENGNWISRDELQKKLSEYQEEKEKVTCTR